MLEQDTRFIPHAQWEYDWARERPAQHRTPLPAVADEVYYRHTSWGDVVYAEVLHVQSLDDFADEHLWSVGLDAPGGNPLLFEGRPVFAQRLDPWPLLRLRVPGIGVGDTREARLRGAAGWLPLDWETRYRPMPTFTIVGS